MIQEFIDKLFASIAGVFAPWFQTVSDLAYIGGWWLIFAVVLFVASVIGFFLPWNWIRAALGFIVWTAGVAAIVATRVWLHMRPKRRR